MTIDDQFKQSYLGFVTPDRIDELLKAGEGPPELGFMARLMTLCSLPRGDQGDRQQYKRVNGDCTLGILAGVDNKLPYGNLPRLLFAWVCTEAVRTQSRHLRLGRSLTEFMNKLGINPVGGRRSRLRDQMHRLFSSHVQLIYRGRGFKFQYGQSLARRAMFWWDPKQPDQGSLWESTVELSEDVFNEIIHQPVPLEMKTLNALKQSSLGLDLYFWLTYRVFTLQQPIALPWKDLYRQFDGDAAKVNDKQAVNQFRLKCLRQLKRISLSWTTLNYSTKRGVLTLSPSKPQIPPKREQD